MKCPQCSFENKPNKKFCTECGAELPSTCPECRAAVEDSEKFCGECGHKLTLSLEEPATDLSFEEKIAKIQRYLPEGLTEKILSQRDRIEGERKQVTVMFCDMEGFTALGERLGPEEAYGIMDEVYEILIHKVHDYEGTVNEMTGDGILALFGAPIALEDAPQRAIRSAMAIHREITSLSDRIGKEEAEIPPLKMRIGIHSGPVVVGTLGNDLRVEFKAVGNTVNLASRTEGLAKPGTTYVTEDTFKLAEGLFRFEALGPQQVKGKVEPVNVYQVIAPSTRRTRFDVSAERGLTPFVGRERELELLLDGFERAKTGRGQAFSIIAEAGVGKSRLLYEFRKLLASEDVTFLEGRCLSYSKGVAYHPVIDILKGNFDIREGDGDLEITEKVRNGLEVLGADQASTLPYLLELLSVKESGIDEIPMSPEGIRDRIIEALKRIILMGSEIRPLVMAFEDLYWVDKSSEHAFKDLLESIPAARILLIFTYRPDFLQTWGAKSFHSQLTLNRLSNRESLSLVTHLLGTEEIDDALQELILEKTEGIPFFIEEFVRSLRDLKIIEKVEGRYHLAKDIQHLTIPSKIQDVIMTRVDSLPIAAKELLQTASVIEREFSYPLIKRVTGLPEQELLKHLSTLKDSEILFERGIYPDTDYIFKHALTRQVVYDSILTRRRKELHEEIGKAIEGLYKATIGEHWGVLSEHFIESGNHEKGATYSRLAAMKHEKTASISNSIGYAERGVRSLELLPQTPEVLERLIDARTVLGLYHLQLNHHIEAREAVDPIAKLAEERNYRKRMAQIYTILGSDKAFIEEDFPEATRQLEEALRISKQINDIPSLLFAHIWAGAVRFHNCEFDKASSHLEDALDINLATNTLWGISVLKSVISFFVQFFPGMINPCFQTSKEAIRIAEESGDTFSKAYSYTAHGVSCYAKGLFEDANKNLLKAVGYHERATSYAWNAIVHEHLGHTYFELGDYQKSMDYHDKARLLVEANGFLPSWKNLNRICIAKAKVMDNEKDIELESLCGYALENKARIHEGCMLRYIGQILLNMDSEHLSAAKDWIEKSIEEDTRNGKMFRLGEGYTLYAEIFKRKGDRTKAKENLIKAIDIYRECGADGWVEKAEKELASIS
jgi:predicted ATPase/class 3 adenylate cyclase